MVIISPPKVLFFVFNFAHTGFSEASTASLGIGGKKSHDAGVERLL
jgi:hypothetical protein